jgi:TRAP-type mannitol/chloroaromatic compound transport system permease large subunit
MLDLIAHNLAPIMFITVMAMLLIGYPVAFTLAAGGMYFFLSASNCQPYLARDPAVLAAGSGQHEPCLRHHAQ